MHIAIIGAGISGLACARQLRAQGHAVTVFEKNSDVGGRMLTQQTEIGGFDHGAQFFTAMSDTFKKEASSWRQAGWIAPWHGKLVQIENGMASLARPSSQRFVALPSMGELTRNLSQGLDVVTRAMVQRMDQDGQTGKWALTIQTDENVTSTSYGPFDAVAVATPSNQAAGLMKSMPKLSSNAEKVGFVPCWSLMLGFQDSLDLAYDGAWVKHHRIAWIARDGSKPDRREGERWIVLARVEWSAENLDETPERVRDKLLKAFQESTGVGVKPILAIASLWKYAQATKPLTKSCLWDEKLKVGACGDWFTTGVEGGGQIEHAFLSGQMLAERIGE